MELLSLSGARGAQLRATVSSFGPLLLGKVLGLNDTQTSVLAMVFKFCDDRDLELLDFADLRAVLQHLTGAGAAELKDYGGMSKQSVGVLLRKMVELEGQGGQVFFGEPEFDLDDLLQVDRDGRGVVSMLELSDAQDKPALFSTFMMWMLARLYNDLPEVGDLDKPKLVFFFDEAHLLFTDASKALLAQVEQVARLIRSKGVGVFFVTQTPKDVPEDVLAQLGHRVQHALRAFTPNDQKALRATVKTFPNSDFYDLEETPDDAGYRRGDGHGAVVAGRALATVRHPADPAVVAHGAAQRDRAAGAARPLAAGAALPDAVDRLSAAGEAGGAGSRGGCDRGTGRAAARARDARQGAALAGGAQRGRHGCRRHHARHPGGIAGVAPPRVVTSGGERFSRSAAPYGATGPLSRAPPGITQGV